MPNLDTYSYRWSPLEQHHNFYKKNHWSHPCNAPCKVFNVIHFQASPPMLNMYPPIILLLTSKRSHLFFPNPTHRTEIGRRLLIATHLDQPNNGSNQKQVLGFALCLLPASSASCSKNGGLQPFCWAKLAHFDFSSSKICWTVHQWGCFTKVLSSPFRWPCCKWNSCLHKAKLRLSLWLNFLSRLE